MMNRFRLELSALFFAALLVGGLTNSAFAAKKEMAPAVVKTIGNPNAPVGGTYYYNIGSEPTTLNPITSSDLYASRVQEFIMDSLLARSEETYEWEPNLADKWEISPDSKTFTFHIRDGATFSDGKPVTAEDVAFSFEVIFDNTYNAAHLRPYYENIEPKVEIVDKQTVKFRTKNLYFGNFNVIAGLTVLPKHFYGNAKEGVKKNKVILGSGPYKLEKYEQGSNIVLVRNDKWWGLNDPAQKGHYNFERIFMRFIKEQNIALERLKKGELDFIDFDPEAYEKKAVGPEWGKTVLKQKIENKGAVGYGYIGWNLRKPMFQDKNVRRALAMLMNRADMNKKFRYSYSLLATGPWYQQSEYADKSVKAIEFDPKKASELLKSAGWTDTDKDGVLDKVINGQKQNFKFSVAYSRQDNEKYYTLYQGDLKKAGIQMDLQFLEWNAFLKSLDDQKFDAIALSWSGGSVDVDPKQIWHSDSAVAGGSNFIGYKNPEVDKMIDAARVEMDKAKRIVLMRKVYKAIAEDAPYAFMFNDRYGFYGHTKRMKMVKPTLGYAIGHTYWWIENN